MSASFLNSIRRDLAEKLDLLPCGKKDLLLREPGNIYSKACTLPQKKTSYKNNISNRLSETVYLSCGAESAAPAYELSHDASAELMRTKYCIRYELGMCPKHHGSKETGPLYLLNNGQRFSLHFDCRNCEMVLKEA
jgi:putative protease